MWGGSERRGSRGGLGPLSSNGKHNTVSGPFWSSDMSLIVRLSSTQSLILDHKQFKAARFIQKHVRGWLVRVRQRNADLAVVVIQKWWRRYQAQRNMVLVAENNLQEAVVAHYHRCATLIQKVFRGWWSRKHIFDLTKLKTLQHLLAEDILHCLGSYLRESKHKSLLPGVHNVRLPRWVPCSVEFSKQNILIISTRPLSSKCLDVTEQLMTTFGYRFYNGQACYKMQKTTAMIEDLRKAFKNSIEYTYVPFHGFNDRRVCERRNSVMDLVEKNPESFDLIQAFVAGQRSMDSKANYKRLLALAHLAEDARRSMNSKSFAETELSLQARGKHRRTLERRVSSSASLTTWKSGTRMGSASCRG